jgi:hypothetical protein
VSLEDIRATFDGTMSLHEGMETGGSCACCELAEYSGDGREACLNCSHPYGRHVAARLAAAIEAGVAVEPDGVGIDTYGKTYVRERSHVLARIMNADLRRLGF